MFLSIYKFSFSETPLCFGRRELNLPFLRLSRGPFIRFPFILIAKLSFSELLAPGD